jgi:hypothetical protein
MQKVGYNTPALLRRKWKRQRQRLGFDFSGVEKPKNEKDLYGLRYAEFVVPLVKAVQELDEKCRKSEVRS